MSVAVTHGTHRPNELGGWWLSESALAEDEPATGVSDGLSGAGQRVAPAEKLGSAVIGSELGAGVASRSLRWEGHGFDSGHSDSRTEPMPPRSQDRFSTPIRVATSHDHGPVPLPLSKR